jgi:hypothetical protein
LTSVEDTGCRQVPTAATSVTVLGAALLSTGVDGATSDRDEGLRTGERAVEPRRDGVGGPALVVDLGRIGDGDDAGGN